VTLVHSINTHLYVIHLDAMLPPCAIKDGFGSHCAEDQVRDKALPCAGQELLPNGLLVMISDKGSRAVC